MKEENKKHLQILVVEDEETTLKLYGSLLKEDGHNPVLAKSAKEALKKVDQMDFDLVFLDLKLPDEDGLALLGKIKDRLNWAPVIIVTANPSMESSIDAINLGGVIEYIVKPFGADDLRIVIRRALEKARLIIENRRLMNKLERTNQALLERVDELEKCARMAMDYEQKIHALHSKVENLEKKYKS